MSPDDQTTALSLRAAYSFGMQHGLQKEVDDIRNMIIEWDSYATSSLRRGYIVDLFERNGILQKFIAEHWAFGMTASGQSDMRRYLRLKRQYEDFLNGHSAQEGTAEAEEEQSEQQFAAESDLRDFLASHLSCVEAGLTLYQDGSRSGVEFAIENGFIDILARDRQGKLVVIELKVGRGRNKTVGQLLYYMGWVDRNLGGAPCRGMIIAKDISDDLRIAVERVPGVSLSRYHLAVTIEAVFPLMTLSQ